MAHRAYDELSLIKEPHCRRNCGQYSIQEQSWPGREEYDEDRGDPGASKHRCHLLPENAPPESESFEYAVVETWLRIDFNESPQCLFGLDHFLIKLPTLLALRQMVLQRFLLFCARLAVEEFLD
jgi:hypothetical protein